MAAAEIVLYRALASRGIVVLWMLEELGLSYRSEMVRMGAGAGTPELLKVNPAGRSPTLVDGDVVVSESPAICIYLADRYGYGTLAPKIEDPRRGAYLKWMVYATAVLEPARELQASTIVPPKFAWGVGWPELPVIVRELVGALEGRDYLLGEAFTACDVMLGSVLSTSLYCKLVPAEPVLTAYVERLNKRPAFERAGRLNWPPELFPPTPSPASGA
jgi:glutathione S-transferase